MKKYHWYFVCAATGAACLVVFCGMFEVSRGVLNLDCMSKPVPQMTLGDLWLTIWFFYVCKLAVGSFSNK